MDNAVFATQEEINTIVGIIYIIINIINNKMYIGLSRNTFRKRYGRPENWHNSASNDHLKYAIKKYKPENFKIILLERNKKIKELRKLEKLYINIFGTRNEELGYNIAEGGSKGHSRFPRMTEKEFRKRCFIKFGDKISFNDYAFRGFDRKMTFNCKCGAKFKKSPHQILISTGCPNCLKDKQRERHSYTLEEFSEKAKLIHNDQYIYNNIEKQNGNNFIHYTCKFCGSDQRQKIGYHLYGKGCEGCSDLRGAETRKIPFENVLNIIKIKLGDCWEIKKDEFIDLKTPINFRCLECQNTRKMNFHTFKYLTHPLCNCGKFDNSLINNTFSIRKYYANL